MGLLSLGVRVARRAGPCGNGVSCRDFIRCRHAVRHGFTLVELLVVVTLIAILIALLLPAVQAARESARRLQCTNHLKQWGLAMTSYENTHTFYPFGTIRHTDSSSTATAPFRRQTHAVSLWPYLELQSLYDRYNFNLSFYNAANLPILQVPVPFYHCPSDRPGVWTADLYTRSRGNYVTNWGYADYNQTKPTDRKPGPFGPNRQTSAAEITNGLSNTMLMGEVVQAVKDSLFDFRGDFFNDDLGAAQFMTYYTPNSGVDSMICTGSPTNEPGPCLTNTSAVYVSARSRHGGGVNVVLGDGAVRFISNSIDTTTWRAIGSMTATQPIGTVP